MKKLRAVAVGLVAALLLVVIGGPLCVCAGSQLFHGRARLFGGGLLPRVPGLPGVPSQLLEEPVPLRRHRGGAGGPVGVRGPGLCQVRLPREELLVFPAAGVMVFAPPGDAGAKLPHSGSFGPAGYPVGLGAARHVRAPGHLPHDPVLPLSAR